MKYGKHRLGDPVQQALEAKSFEPERHAVASAICQNRRVDPHPQIPQDQGNSDEQQAQERLSRAGANPRLTELPVARLDAKALAIALADFGRRTVDSPGSEEQLAVATFVGF